MASLLDLIRQFQPAGGGSAPGGWGGLAQRFGSPASGLTGAIGQSMGSGRGAPSYGQIRQGMSAGQGALLSGNPANAAWMNQMGQQAANTPSPWSNAHSPWGPLGSMFAPNDQMRRALGGYSPEETNAFVNGAGGPAELMRGRMTFHNQQARANAFRPMPVPGAASDSFYSALNSPNLWGGMQQAVGARRSLGSLLGGGFGGG